MVRPGADPTRRAGSVLCSRFQGQRRRPLGSRALQQDEVRSKGALRLSFYGRPEQRSMDASERDRHDPSSSCQWAAALPGRRQQVLRLAWRNARRGHPSGRFANLDWSLAGTDLRRTHDAGPPHPSSLLSHVGHHGRRIFPVPPAPRPLARPKWRCPCRHALFRLSGAVRLWSGPVQLGQPGLSKPRERRDNLIAAPRYRLSQHGTDDTRSQGP